MVHQYLKVIASDQNFNRNHFNHIDWDRFSSRIVFTGAASLFYPKISEIKDFIPDHIYQFFRTHYENALIFQDFALHILNELQQKLCDTGRIVITQGLALYETVYHEPLCRSMGDIDLFLPDGNSDAVKRILEEYGFRNYRNYNNVLEYKQIMLDLHDGLWGTDRFIQRNYIIPEYNIKLQPSSLIEGFHILCPEHLALHCAFHGIKHSFDKEIWDLDLAMLYNKGHLTEKTFSKQEHILKSLTFEHLYIIGMLPPIVPESNKYSPSLVMRKSIIILSRNIKRAGLGQITFSLMCSSFFKSVQYLFALFIPPKHILHQMYGTFPWPLLIVIRLFHIAKHIWRTLFCRR